MSKKVSDVQRTTEFFETAELAVINTVFEIIKGTVKRRNGVTASKPKVKKSPAKPTATLSVQDEAAA